MSKTVDHWIAVADTLKQQRDQAEKERDALRTDNEVLHEEVQMQLMELGMKGIGDRMSQYLRADDECNKCAAMEATP
jgi:hypothetical protein